MENEVFDIISSRYWFYEESKIFFIKILLNGSVDHQDLWVSSKDKGANSNLAKNFAEDSR